jgi:hypothetical protein
MALGNPIHHIRETPKNLGCFPASNTSRKPRHMLLQHRRTPHDTPSSFPNRAHHPNRRENAVYIFFRSFLSNPSRVTSLNMDNPQGFSQGKDGYCKSLYSAPSILPETENEDGYPLVRHNGLMRGHLHPLLNHFKNLHRLFIRTIGQDDSTDQHYLASREKACYKEIAMFISSTAGTLETLVFEQGIIQEGNLTGRLSDLRRFHQVGQPMDTYFLEFIHPILLSTKWKKLKKITIHSVGGKPRGLNGWRTP